MTWHWSFRLHNGDIGVTYILCGGCRHGNLVRHTLDEALLCGLLRDVRALQGHSRPQAAKAIGVGLTTIKSWEDGWRHPAGLQRRALESYLMNSFPATGKE